MKDLNGIVILSGVSASQSDALTQSKDLLSPDSTTAHVILSEAFFAERRTQGSPRAAFLACPEQAKRAEGPSLRRNKREATFLIALSLTLLLTTLAHAQTLTGTVKNSTTGKPSAGDEVVLLKLGAGMDEAGRTKTDANGKFSFKLDDAQSPHLVRAIHQEVTYHRMAPPGTTSVEVEVFDVAKKVDNIKVVADIMRAEAQQGKLVIVRELGVQNASKPPRTQMNDRNIEFYIPDGAQVITDSGTATTEGGNPLRSAPVPAGEKNRYSFIFPLRPGLTRFEVAYQMPYSGGASLDPKSIYPLDHFVVMLPKSMQFTAAAATSAFKLVDYTQEPDAAVQVASNTTPGQNLAFKLSGEGVLEAQQEGSQAQSGAQSGNQPGAESGAAPPAGAQNNNRPGGGLGPPIDAPDPLQQYRWWILGGFVAVLLLGGVIVASRQQSASRALARQRDAASGLPSEKILTEEDDYGPAEVLAPRAASVARPGSMLMEGIKEELFQLEVERRQGQISQAEYEQAKSALDQTLDRALKREAQKA